MSYADFLARKTATAERHGPDLVPSDVHPMLHSWQNDVVRWAAARGRAALFEDCGLGKTFQQLEWARLVADRALIIAPLSVAQQTQREAHRLDIDLPYIRARRPGDGLHITNYEMADKVDPSSYDAVVLDESSILKNVDSKTRRRLTDSCRDVPYKLAATATPAPNDVAEIVNHAEWLGHMSRPEMLAAYFINDQDVGAWRLKGHARDPLLDWMATWVVAARYPSDVGGDDAGYRLPPLHIRDVVVPVDIDAPGQLFPTDLGGVGGRANVRRQTLDARVSRTVECTDHGAQHIVWCGLNDEADGVAAAIGPDAVNVKGADSPDVKVDALRAFSDGVIRVLVTKPSIAGFGMNFQNCNRMTFCGIGDSYETYYQAIRRCWRYGQQNPVHVDVVVSELERQIVDNVNRKARQAGWLVDELAARSPITLDRKEVLA